jgi:hypothetical protein
MLVSAALVFHKPWSRFTDNSSDDLARGRWLPRPQRHSRYRAYYNAAEQHHPNLRVHLWSRERLLAACWEKSSKIKRSKALQHVMSSRLACSRVTTTTHTRALLLTCVEEEIHSSRHARRHEATLVKSTNDTRAKNSYDAQRYGWIYRL